MEAVLGLPTTFNIPTGFHLLDLVNHLREALDVRQRRSARSRAFCYENPINIGFNLFDVYIGDAVATAFRLKRVKYFLLFAR